MGGEVMTIHKAAEDYLEAMLMLKERNGYVRSLDIATLLGVSKPSVSYAVKQLREGGYITMSDDSMITLSKSGLEIAERIYTRHKVLTEFFINLGVDKKTACEDACKIEHDISEKTFKAICKHASLESK